MVLLSPPLQARTTNFFGPPGVRLGLLHGSSLGFIIYLISVKIIGNRVLERLECLLVALKEARQPLYLLCQPIPLCLEHLKGAVGIHIVYKLP